MTKQLGRIQLQKKELDSRKFVNCSWHKPPGIVHRISGVPATEHIISKLDDLARESHGCCLPCHIRENGVETAIKDTSREEVREALRWMAKIPLAEGIMKVRDDG